MAGYDDLYAPKVLLVSDGGEDYSDIAADVTAMEYTDESAKMDKCLLTVRNPYLKYANDPRFDHGIKLRLRFGYPGQLSEERQLIVTGGAPSFTMGMPAIVLTAYDAGRALAHGGKARNWGAVDSSEIARQLAVEHNLEPHVHKANDARRQARVQPANVTAYEFLAQLARPLNFQFYVRDGGLWFVPEDTEEAPRFAYRYYRDRAGTLLEFTPSVKAAKPPASTHANGRHQARTGPQDPSSSKSLGRFPIDHQAHQGFVQPIEITVATFGAGVTMTTRSATRDAPASTVFEGGGQRVATTGPGSLATATTAALFRGIIDPTAETVPGVQALHARAAQTRVRMDAVKASAKWVGQPLLRARQVIQIDVVEKRYTGLWHVTRSVHRIDAQGGYTTTAELARDGLNSGPRTARRPANQVNGQQVPDLRLTQQRVELSHENHSAAIVTRVRNRPVQPRTGGGG